mgnify:CR=1 FL=1
MITIIRAAVLAALFLCSATLSAGAQDVALSSRDGKIELSGTLLGFDGEFYRVETEYGELTVDSTGVQCEGPGCPNLDPFVAELQLSGSATMGEVLMPALIDGFAQRNGYTAVREDEDEHRFTYRLIDEKSEQTVALFMFRASNSDEGFADLLADEADIVMSLREMRPEERVRAREAGLGAHYCDLDKIALSDDGQFLDDEDRRIAVLFKLYPWEDLLRDDYADHIEGSGCLFLEPAWKALLSNKGLLPVLWEMFEDHPNLLPAFFEQDVGEAMAGRGSVTGRAADSFDRARAGLARAHVRKPILSREGASVEIVKSGQIIESASNTAYAEHPRILQAYAPLPQFDGMRPVVGAWIIGQTCAGIGLREDRSRITQDLSRFKPHYIAPYSG